MVISSKETTVEDGAKDKSAVAHVHDPDRQPGKRTTSKTQEREMKRDR